MKLFRKASRGLDFITIVHQGWLLKILPRGLLRKWLKSYHWRWFMLRHVGDGRFALDYYSNATCHDYRGTLDLSTIKEVVIGLTCGPDDAIFQRNNMFAVITSACKLHLVAETESEVNRWAACISSFCRVPITNKMKINQNSRCELQGHPTLTTTESRRSESSASGGSKDSNYILLSECYTLRTTDGGRKTEDCANSAVMAKDDTDSAKKVTASGRYYHDNPNISNRTLTANISLSTRDIRRPPPKPKTPFIVQKNFGGTTPDLRMTRYFSASVGTLSDDVSDFDLAKEHRDSAKEGRTVQATSLGSLRDVNHNEAHSPTTRPRLQRAQTVSTIERVRQEALGFADQLEKAYLEGSGIESAQSLTATEDASNGNSEFEKYWLLDTYERTFLNERPNTGEPGDHCTFSHNEENVFDVYNTSPVRIADSNGKGLSEDAFDDPIIESPSPEVTHNSSSQPEEKDIRHHGPLGYNHLTANGNNNPSILIPSPIPAEHADGCVFLYDFPKRVYPPIQSLNTVPPHIYVNSCPGYMSAFEDSDNLNENLPSGSLKDNLQASPPLFWGSGSISPSAIGTYVNIVPHKRTPPAPPKTTKYKGKSLPSINSDTDVFTIPPVPRRPRYNTHSASKEEASSLSSSRSMSFSSQPSSPRQGEQSTSEDDAYSYVERGNSSDESQVLSPKTLEVYYISLDLEDNSSRSPRKRETVYNTVDFIKTKGLIVTRQNVEENYKIFK